VDNIAWASRKHQLEEKYGAGCHQIISAIKRGLAKGRLASIKAAMRTLQAEPGKAPVVVAHLNNSIGRGGSLSFRWFPSQNNQSGKLLIRNESVGLIVKSAPNLAPEALMITADTTMPVCSLAPEIALSRLSEHVCIHTPKHVRICSKHLH
jgi:hypothetical protein